LLLVAAMGLVSYSMIQFLHSRLGVSVIAANLIVDLLYAWLDPRVRLQ